MGAFAALLALLVLLLYLSHYRNSVKSSNAAVPVLVATHLITHGTAGDVLGTNGGYQPTSVASSAVKTGAISDPAALKGKVAVADIFPGQQLTLTDFTATATATLGSRLVGKQRAMSIPVDEVHGMIGSVVGGDRVDIYADVAGVVAPIAQNVYVLGVGAASAGGGLGSSTSSTSLILRVTPSGASRLAFASDNAKIWVVLRPATGGGVVKTHGTIVPPLVHGSTVPQGD